MEERRVMSLAPLHLDAKICACGNRMMRIIRCIDRPPAGWFALDVLRAPSRGDWIALMVDVPIDELKHCRCGVAMLYVHPSEHRPGNRTAREAWVRVPGKHRSKHAAWDVLQGMMATRH